jgi:hypothetical protein
MLDGPMGQIGVVSCRVISAKTSNCSGVRSQRGDFVRTPTARYCQSMTSRATRFSMMALLQGPVGVH